MAATETIEDFYKAKFNWLPDNLSQQIGHFNVFSLEDCYQPNAKPVVYARRDFYKISLIRGKNVVHYADKSIELDGTALIFFNPNVPYTFERIDDDNTGAFCIFKESFFTEALRSSIHDLPMFMPGGKPTYILNPEQDTYVSQVFEKMLNEINPSTALSMICCAITLPSFFITP